MASPDLSLAAEEPSTIIDDLHYSLQAEQKNTQKRTFTSWVNSQLEKHSPPSVVSDLYTDIGEGNILLDLLEVLSGQQLPREKGSNTFQCRSNIEHALTFLKNRSIKLINIHVADIIEGKPSIVLGLIWSIILHFHIEELAWTLTGGYGHRPEDSPSAVSTSTTANPSARTNTTIKERWKMSAKKALLLWAKEQCAMHGSISVADFKSSWRNGLAFLAVIHALRPDLVDLEQAKSRSNKENLKEAFDIAEKELNIPRLLEPEDVDVVSPDEKSIMTYVSQFLQYFKSLPVPEEEMKGKVRETLSWLSAQKEKFEKLLSENEDTPFCKKFQEMLSFMETFNEEKKAFLPILASKRNSAAMSDGYPRIREAWDNLTSQMNEWIAKLHCSLPSPLDAIESWLQETELQLAEDLPDSHDHSKAVAILEGKVESLKSLMECSERHLETLQSFENRDEEGKPLVPHQKLEEMRRRLSNVQLVDFNILVEYQHSVCSAILEELTSKLNIWHIKYGTKESVELLLSDWEVFITEKGFLAQLENIFQVCEEKKKKIIKVSNLGADPQDVSKLFIMVESKICKCREYICNVNATLQKVLSSWIIYRENLNLLTAWLEETRKEHSKDVPTETLATWNSRHGSLNEAGNFLIECCNEDVGSAVSAELKKLNRKWAKLIKKTQFEMRMLQVQEGDLKLMTDSNGNVKSLTGATPGPLDCPVNTSEETPGVLIENTIAISLPTDLLTHGSELVSEQEVKQNFEEAQKVLEASVLNAMQLLGQETQLKGPVSKYEETLSILDAEILDRFLKAAEQLKAVLPAHEKAAAEERSKDVCERWKAVRREIVSYIHLKMEMEREKLNQIFSKLNEQVNKEKKLLTMGKTKGLIEEHEATFSQQGSLSELNACLEALKSMSEKMSEEEKQLGTKMSVEEYEKQKEELQACASEVYSALMSQADAGHSSEKEGLAPASANGDKASPLNLCDISAERNPQADSGKHAEPEVKFQNGDHSAEKTGRDGDLPLKTLKESYHTAKHNLKLHLHNIRENVASGFADDLKDASCLQKKLHELEILDNKGDSSWKHFESMALKLEKFASQLEKPAVSDKAREELLKEWNMLRLALSERIASLKAVLEVITTAENEWLRLQTLNEQLCKTEIPQCVLTNTDSAFKRLKEMQESVGGCVEQCNRLEQGSLPGCKIVPVDQQAAEAVIAEYRVLLEELGCKIQVIETILQDLKSFLASLRHFKESTTSSGDASTTQTPPQQVGLLKISLLKRKAKFLDKRLKQVNIDLENAECGPKTCCEKMVSTLDVKDKPTGGAAEEQKDVPTGDAQEEFAWENSELLKNIQDIQEKINKVGLKDPTIPAVQQRSKSLSELRQKLDRLVAELKALKGTASQVLQLTGVKGEEIYQQLRVTENLWKEAKHSIAERQELCARVMELLKQYHSCKNCLESIIQKQEHALSQQASYMGKDNLQRIIANVNMVKNEFSNHSEDVDKINQICKNLQIQLNKMKSFEEPPFENEANAIVDRWLDINERTENYCDNLGRALALWDKLLNFSSSIDGWLSTELKKVDNQRLTEEELAELEVGLRFQEENLVEFDRKVDEIQGLLNGTEPPLELQVIKSSLLNKMELVRKHLSNKLIPAELNGNSAELKEDLDLAKTQIGMTESLLKALSPSDTLEIFTKLEEIHQKILQQKCHVKLLQKETGCMSPEVIELKKQLKSVTDLFNSKKQIFQDHFTALLNYQCEDFNDWFNSTRQSLKECFDPSETRKELVEKIQQLVSFLTFEGKDSDICEVKTLLAKVKSYLPKANVSQLSSWVKDQEEEIQKFSSQCQAREKELSALAKRFTRFEEDFNSLEEWLNLQEEKLQKGQMKKAERAQFYQLLLKQRESVNSLAWLTDWFRKSGFSSDEMVEESAQLINRYKVLLSQVQKSLGASQVRSADEKNFEDLAQSTLSWVESLKELLLGLSSEEPKMPLEERLHQVKEIISLKEEGDAKLQNIVTLGEHLKSKDGNKNLATQQMISDIRNQWECTVHLATEYLRHQEQLQHQKEQERQKEGNIRAALSKLGKQKQEFGLGRQPGSHERQSQSSNDTELLHEVEGLTSLLNELKGWQNTMEDCNNSPSAEESLVTLQHLHEGLLRRLQIITELLEGCTEEQLQCEKLMRCLRTTLKEILKPMNTTQKQVQTIPLCQTQDTLQEIGVLVESIRQKILPQECKPMKKDVVDMPQPKPRKRFKYHLGTVEKETGNVQSNILKFSDEMQTPVTGNGTTETGKLGSSDVSLAAEKISSVTLPVVQKRKSEKFQRVKIKMDRESPKLFQEWLVTEEQPCFMSAESDDGPASDLEGLKDSLMESHNFRSSTSQTGKPLKMSEQMLVDDNLPHDGLQERPLGYKKKLQAVGGRSEMPQTTLRLMKGKVMGADLAALSVTHPSLERQVSEMEIVSQMAFVPEDQTHVEYTEIEQKVDKVKNQAAELDIALLKNQLQEIENLCAQLEEKKAKDSLFCQNEPATVAERSKSSLPDAQRAVSCWDSLLQDLRAMKQAKEDQCRLVNNYQECLSAVQSSMKHLSVEKESIKTRGPMQVTVLLKNIEKCLASIQREKILLNKLKAEQENLSGHLTSMDKELTQSQVKQVKQLWEHIQDFLQRKHLRVAAEVDEFKSLMEKAQELQKLLQQQHCLQTGLDAPNGETQVHLALLATELQTLKHRLSLLKRDIEMRMKRLWSDLDKKTLERAINNLQSQVEELEQLTPREEVLITGHDPQAYEIARRTEEAILWVRVLVLHLDEKPALFPDDLALQIKNCQATVSAVEKKEPDIVQLADEAQQIALQLDSNEATILRSLSQELQTCYQDLVLKIAQKLQQLESQLEKRQKLFADVGKIETQLRNLEGTLNSDIGKANLKSELDHWQAILEEISKLIREVEGLIDLCDSSQRLNIFEQLFLNDYLRSLMNRGKRAHRLIQIKCCMVKNKIDVCAKLSEIIMVLDQELKDLQYNEMKLDSEKLLQIDQEVEDQLGVLKERAKALQSSLSYLHKHKEIWGCQALKWDVSSLEELQSQIGKIRENLELRVKCFDDTVAEYNRCQTVLSKAETIITTIQKDCDALRDGLGNTTETSLLSAKSLNQKLQLARSLVQEALGLLDTNEGFGASLKEAKKKQLKSLEGRIDGLAQMIQKKILTLQAQYRLDEGFQKRLDLNLQALKQIRSQLQQPLLVDLEIHTVPYEKMYCKVLEDAAEGEFCAVEALINEEKGAAGGNSAFTDELDKEVQKLKIQMKADIAARRSALDEAYEIVELYNEAVQKATDLFGQCEAHLSSPLLSLDELEDAGQLSHAKQEEFEAAKAEVEVLTSTLENKIKPEAKPQLEKTLGDLGAKSLIVTKQVQKRKSDVQSFLENYQSFTRTREKIHADLKHVEKVLWKSLCSTPLNYKEALEQSERSKMLISQLVSTEEDLKKLRQDSGHLSLQCREKDCVLLDTIVSTLWLKWLRLLEAAREWESKCEEQNQEWKSVNEEMERETIILDNLQEEVPENPKEREGTTKEELQEFLECVSYCEESVNAEKLLLRLILHRIRSILNVPECPSEDGGNLPLMSEIQAMQERLKELSQKVQKQKDAVLSEIEERAKTSNEIDAVMKSLQDTISLLHQLNLEAHMEKAGKLEEIRRATDSQKQALEQIMDKLRMKYSEMYTIVPVEIETHLENCKQTLKDLEEKVSTEVLNNSPRYTADKKIEDINKGLQAIESMLQQKTENIAKAKEIQQRIWDLLDLWHYKMNELDSDVQDTVEQDPCQGQELMDRLMVPLQKYQQVSQRAERRTADINRASSKLEECDELLKSTQVWLENTGRLLTEEAKSDTAKALNKHADALQMALEDSEQKQSILSAIYPELEEFSTLIETENKVQELNDMNEQVTALQQKIMGILPHIQHLADEVEAIECEVKTMEKNINKIKTILSPSEDALDFSPKEHLKHGQVILAHISPMQKALTEIQSYKESLRLPDVKIQPFSVFQRTKQLLKELKTLEIITKEQNKLLEPIVKEVEESEHQIDTLKLVLKSHLDGFPIETPLFTQAATYPEDEKMEKIKQQIDQLCQKKEDILTTMKNSLLELHQRQEESESEDEILESQVPKESGGGSEWQPQKRGSLSLLPSLVEEAEDSSFHSEGESSTPVTSAAEGLWRILGDSNEILDPEKSAPEAAEVLHACQAQVAELELWLDQAKESLRSAAHTRQMQQALEQHLAECQLMLSEIEQKVTSLLDRDQLGLQGEAESLSLKLKDVKCNLEKVQGMLQDKSTEEQLNSDKKICEIPLKTPTFTLPNGFPVAISDRPLLSSSKSLHQQQEMLLKLSEQNNLIDFIEVYVATMQPRSEDSTVLDLQASPETPVSGSEPHGPIPNDQAGDKWQHLQEELLFKMNSRHCQFAKPQIATKINILPKGASSSVRTPTVEELKAYTAQLGSLSQEASVQIQENMTGEGSLNLDQKLFELLLAISRCLSNMEQMLNSCVLTSEEAPVQQVLYETLSAELQILHKDIGDKKVDLLKSITVAGGNADRFSQCFSSLQAWLQLTQAAAASRSESMKTELDHHSSYQNEIRLLYDVLIEKKSSLQQSFGARGRDSDPNHLQHIDAFEVELQNFEMQVAKLRDHGERFNLPVAAVQEVYKLEDMLDDLWGILRAKQKELTTPFVAEHQYEVLLKGLEELVRIGQEKVAQVPKLKPTSQQELEFLLQNHKDFVQNLHTHMLATQMCSKRVAPSSLQKKEAFWNKLVEKVKSLEEQAVQYGIHLEILLQDWIEFDEMYGSFLQKLEAASSAVPSVGLVEETEERLLERIGLLQQIKQSTEEEQARYQQLMAEGKKVVALVNCPELQSQIETLEGQWESLCTKVDQELQRLETMLRLLSSYNRDSKELAKWLESAQQRINDWKEQSLSASQDLDTVRSNICSLLAFSKEIDHRSSLKSSVISTGNQLLLIKACDTATLRTFLAELEQKWADLMAHLPSIQEKFHQLQMAKLASNEAITELTAWMDRVDQQRREEAAVSPHSPVHQLKCLLKKYREYLMEMNFKQWTVDYVNQSLLQMTTCDVESKRYERTMFAERLGEMNLQWHQLQGSLNEKIKELEHLLESVSENETRARSLESWLEAQSSQLKLMKKPASFILVQKRVEDCKALENQLAIKSEDVDELKQNYTASIDCARALEEMASRINELDEMRTKVDNQVTQLKTSTLSALEKWKIYDEVWEEVRLMLARALYCMELNKPLVITVEALRSQVENLQLLQEKAESSEESWTRLQAAADDLKELCDPSCSEIIEQKYKEAHKRWTQMNEEIGDQFKKAQTSLSLLESFVDLHAKMTAELDKYEEQCNSLLGAKIPSSRTMDFLKEKMQDVQKLQHGLQNVKGSFHKISELADKIAQLTEPAAHSLLLEKIQPLERVSCLEKMLQMKADEFQFELLQLEDFESCLEKLEKYVKDSSDILDNPNLGDEDSDQLLNKALSLTALSPEMESLNEVSFKIPLNDFTTKRLQDLNWRWTQRTAMALERCSELQGIQSDEKKFLRKCQNWVQFLEKAKEDLKKEVPGTLEKLQEQQKQQEMLQAEISINQQIFNNILSKALHMLESGEAENRTEFISKLTLLKEQWQSIIQMAQQRKAEIDGLVKQWQKFRNLLQDLTKFLMDTDSFVAAVKSQEKYNLHQARNLSHSLKNKEILLQRWQTRYSLTLDIGETLLSLADPEAKTGIQMEISGLREKWGNTQLQVETVSKRLQGTIQMWKSCEKQVEDLGHKLQELKARIEDPLPVEDDDLHTAKEHVKELEKSLANWDQNLKELGSMKADLAHYILAEDMLVLKEQVAHLHRQWEELCLRISLRKQEIEDRLNTWIVFNEKNKELCAWLVQMESQVLQSTDVSIEDMIEKLQKDCMEEINLFSENKLAHLKQMGEQLIKASNKCRAMEIDEKLNKISSRWQHLFDVIGGRVKKLKETFAFIQQLDKKMSNLRTWLARIESELSKPVVYDICDDQEIQKRLQEQQDLQRDIEQHSAGVESVFNICEVLLHDSDACANETECDSIQQTTRSLDRRWRNICAMSMERRMKIEETWRLWQKFLDDYSRFEDWLKMAERTAAYPNSSEVSYTNAKEELKKFEAFQRQIHERLTQLELINKQYRRLARENRTDSASKLKQMVHEGNQRWDNLQKRVAAILRRLKHFTNQWEEFVGTKDSILVWLTEMDLQLTNVEHFSESNLDDKMRQLNGFQQEITLNTNKIDQLIVFGETLIQKCEPSDAVVLEDELEELHKYCQDVFGRVSRFHQRLTFWHPGLEDEKESSENEADSEDVRGVQNDPWHKKTMADVPPSQQSLCHLMPPAGHERSGCETPVSIDSIPLEWDHTGDVGGSSSHEDEEEEPYFSALSGKSASDSHTWHSPDSSICRKHLFNQGEVVSGNRDVLSSSPGMSTPYKPGYVKQLSNSSVGSIKEISTPGEEAPDSQSLAGVPSVKKQPGVIESHRWDLIQAQDLSNKLRMKQNLQQWQQLNSDLTNISTWLDKMEGELEELQEAEPASSIQDLEQRVKKLKDMLKAFDNYKALALSVNLTSKDFKQADNTESKELQNRLRRVNLRWEKANLLMGNWRKSLQEALIHCQDFHELNQKLLLWLAGAETRRHQAQVKDLNADPHAIQESRKELMQLENELLEKQLQVNTLQEIATHLLVRSHGTDYAEADEKVHVIGKKLKQLLEGVSHDLKDLQGRQDIGAFLSDTDELNSEGYYQLPENPCMYTNKAAGWKTLGSASATSLSTEDMDEAQPVAPKTRSFFSRVLRAALPLQLLFLLLLFFISLIPFSEEDYSCTQANNFARSFYPMLRYMNGPPPT